MFVIQFGNNCYHRTIIGCIPQYTLDKYKNRKKTNFNAAQVLL